jgi:hypothetical protein
MNSKPTRRSFFGQAGAALAAPLAATAAVAAPGSDSAARLAALEDANTIRSLLAPLLAVPSRMGLDSSVRSIVADRDETITIAADRTATIRVACTVESETPLESCGTLVEMARLQGDGLVRSTYRRVLAGTFVKTGGIWSFERATLEVTT